MKKILTQVVLGVGALLLIGGGLLLATGGKSGCPHGCCTGPNDCPTPSCCVRK